LPFKPEPDVNRDGDDSERNANAPLMISSAPTFGPATSCGEFEAGGKRAPALYQAPGCAASPPLLAARRIMTSRRCRPNVVMRSRRCQLVQLAAQFGESMGCSARASIRMPPAKSMPKLKPCSGSTQANRINTW